MVALQVSLSTLLPVLKLQQFTHPTGCVFLSVQPGDHENRRDDDGSEIECNIKRPEVPGFDILHKFSDE